MSIYCKCPIPAPEEVRRGLKVCLNCNEQIEPSSDELDYDDFSEAEDVINVEEMERQQEQSITNLDN